MPDTYEVITLPYLIFLPDGRLVNTQEYDELLDQGWEPCGVCPGPPIQTPEGQFNCFWGQLRKKKSPVLVPSRIELGRFQS